MRGGDERRREEEEEREEEEGWEGRIEKSATNGRSGYS